IMCAGGFPVEDAAAVPAKRPSIAATKRNPRAVVRWLRIGSGSNQAHEQSSHAFGDGIASDAVGPKCRTLAGSSENVGASVESAPDEDRGLREARARGRKTDRSRDEAARPLRRRRAQSLRHTCRGGGASVESGDRRGGGRARVARIREGAGRAAKGAGD